MANVLILAREEVVAALLGLLVELCGHQPVYAPSGKTAADACAELACSKLVIDCDHWECSERALTSLHKKGVKILLFSPSRVSSEMRGATAAIGTRAFTLPIGPEAFGKLLG